MHVKHGSYLMTNMCHTCQLCFILDKHVSFMSNLHDKYVSFMSNVYFILDTLKDL